MTKNIDDILKELLAIDPSLFAHEDSLRALISELLAKKPDTRLDQEFVARLRAQLLGQATPSPFTQYFSYAPYIVGVLAVLIALPFGYRYFSPGENTGAAVFAMNQQIQHLQGNAYGSIQPQESGHGGGGVAYDSATAPQTPQPTNTAEANSAGATVSSAPASAPVAVTKMAMGMGGGAVTSRMMAPQGEINVYSYIYKGEPLDLASTTEDLVYSRVKEANSGNQIASQLSRFNFGLIHLNAFSDTNVRSFELAENKPFGYLVDVNFSDGTINVNADYTQWPSLNGKNGALQPLPTSAMPKSDELIAIAKQFLDDHGVDLSNYADPIVQQYAEAPASDSATQFAPDQMTIVYPLKISGTEVYEDGAYPYGLQVGVSVRDKKVMSVYNLTSQTYTSSSYKLETDSNKILSVLEKGGPHAWVPEASDGVTIKKVEIEVGTPTKILLHVYNYANNQSQELFVPALNFPVTKAPAGEQYYPKNIVIPLVPELLNQAGGPAIYNALR